MDLNLNLEFYPKLSDDYLQKGINKIKNNTQNWNLPFFKDVYSHSDLKSFRNVCNQVTSSIDLKNLIILGTGGSIQTLLSFAEFFDINVHPIMSSRPSELKNVLDSCSPDNSLVIPISRGGKTLDINSVLGLFSNFKMLPLSSRGPMFEYVQKKSQNIIAVPDLAGRFAAHISSVFLIPAIIGGIDVDLLLKQLKNSYDIFFDLENDNVNIALKLAIYLKALYDKGYRNVFNMPYNSFLEGSVGLFVQQLSESTGKDGLGLLGTMQSAPLCQHSVLELLLGGSKGHSIPIIWKSENELINFEINNPHFNLVDTTTSEIISHQADATFHALLKKKVPSAKIQIEKQDLTQVSQLIAFIQSSIYFLCMLFNINWENNPSVNLGKDICNESIRIGKTPTQRLETRRDLTKDWIIN